MPEHLDYEKMLHERAAKMLRVHGILSIIFGALGTFFGLIFCVIGLIALSTPDYTASDAVGNFILGVIGFIFFVVPHVYLIIAGVYLLRSPRPSVARTLVILNLVIGVFWNVALLVFAIINLTQIGDYERGYKHSKA